MPWTATLVDAQARDGKFVFSIVYSDGASKAIQDTTVVEISLAIIQREARRQVAVYEAASAAKDELPKLVFGPIDLTPEVVIPPPPDPDAIAQAAFLALWFRYRGRRAAIDAGLLPPGDASAAAMLAELTKTFLDRYTDLMGRG